VHFGSADISSLPPCLYPSILTLTPLLTSALSLCIYLRLYTLNCTLSYGDPSVSSTDFDVRVAVITRLYFSLALTDQCLSNPRLLCRLGGDLCHF
ncbi:MAG: hypothetical protein ACKPCM_06110, partial [Pseudanabaena sp.]